MQVTYFFRRKISGEKQARKNILLAKQILKEKEALTASGLGLPAPGRRAVATARETSMSPGRGRRICGSPCTRAVRCGTSLRLYGEPGVPRHRSGQTRRTGPKPEGSLLSRARNFYDISRRVRDPPPHPNAADAQGTVPFQEVLPHPALRPVSTRSRGDVGGRVSGLQEPSEGRGQREGHL